MPFRLSKKVGLQRKNARTTETARAQSARRGWTTGNCAIGEVRVLDEECGKRVFFLQRGTTTISPKTR